MFFKSLLHQTRFLAAVTPHVDRISGRIDPEYGAAFYLLTSDSLTWESAQGYIDADGIDFRRMRKGLHLSHGHDILLRLAGNLFNSCFRVNPVEFVILDTDNFMVALTAQQLRFQPPRIEDLKED